MDGPPAIWAGLRLRRRAEPVQHPGPGHRPHPAVARHRPEERGLLGGRPRYRQGRLADYCRPGGNGGNGGIEYGTATDGRRIYAAEGDTARIPYTLGGSGPYAGQVVTGGSWAALDPATGKIFWQTPDPNGSPDTSYVTAANGVIYAGSLASTGTGMYALDAATGTILWSFDSGGSVTGGASIVGGIVYWGSGYCGTACFGTPGDNNNKLYAFGLGR